MYCIFCGSKPTFNSSTWLENLRGLWRCVDRKICEERQGIDKAFQWEQTQKEVSEGNEP